MEKRIVTENQWRRIKKIYHTAFEAIITSLRVVFLLVICTSCYEQSWGFVVFSVPILAVLISPLVERSWNSFWKDFSRNLYIEVKR